MKEHSTGTAALLETLDELARVLGLDEGDPCVPVDARLLFDAVNCELWHWFLPEGCCGVSVYSSGAANVTVNKDLWEFDKSADYRETCAHEIAHVIRGHEGQYQHWREKWQTEESGEADYQWYRCSRPEYECRVTAAYLLIRKRALEALEGQDTRYMAVTLDVPPYLLNVRESIWNNYKR